VKPAWWWGCVGRHLATCKTGNQPTGNETLGRRGTLAIWFDPEMNGDAAPQEDAGREHPVSRFKGTLHLQIDITGIEVKVEGLWHARRHGGPKQRVRRKIHLGIDDESPGVRAAEITGSHTGKALALPDLLSRIPAQEQIGSVKLPGQRFMTPDFDRNVAGPQVRIAALNGCTAPCIPVRKAVRSVCPANGKHWISPDLRSKACTGSAGIGRTACQFLAVEASIGLRCASFIIMPFMMTPITRTRPQRGSMASDQPRNFARNPGLTVV